MLDLFTTTGKDPVQNVKCLGVVKKEYDKTLKGSVPLSIPR